MPKMSSPFSHYQFGATNKTNLKAAMKAVTDRMGQLTKHEQDEMYEINVAVYNDKFDLSLTFKRVCKLWDLLERKRR